MCTDSASPTGPMPLASHRPLIVVAAGGDGSRMGGGKPGRLLLGRRLVDRAADWARLHGDAVAVAVRPGAQDWACGLPAIIDEHAGIGPISALASGFAHAAAAGRSHLLLIGCDMPFLPVDLVTRLAAAIGTAGAAMPISGGHLHPLAALWRVDTDAVERYIADGGQSVRRFAETVGMVTVAWDDEPDPFVNINEAASLAAAETRIRTPAR